MDNNLRNLFKKKFDEKLNVNHPVSGTLGNADGTVDVPNKPGYVYANIQGELIEVFNKRVSALPGVEVWIGVDPIESYLVQVLDYRSSAIGIDPNASSFMKLHGTTHSWGGNDPAPIWEIQIMDGRVTAHHDLTIIIYPITVKIPVTGYMTVSVMTPHDLTSLVPATPGYWVAVLVTIKTDGTFVYTTGTPVLAASFTTANIPAAPADTLMILAAVRLAYGQTILYESLDGSDILDLRFASMATFGDYLKLDASNGPITGQLGSSVATGTAPFALTSTTLNTHLNADLLDGLHASEISGSGGHTIQDEGTPLTARANLNFVGTGVMVTDDAGNSATKVTIPGASSGIVYAPGDISNPPTQAELTTLIGSPITIGPGKAYYLNDITGFIREYLALSDGFYWWVLPLAKTAYAEPTSASATNAASHQTTPTYDGSGQVVHPDILYFENGWNGHKYWMAINPFPGGNAAYENPCMLVSEDGDTWSVPAGLTNPIVGTPGTGHYNDPMIIMTPDLTIMYMIFGWDDGSANKLYRMASTNGVTWSSPVEIFSGATASYISPVALWDGTQYCLWYQDGSAEPHTLKRRTCATMTGTWSASTTCTGTVPSGLKLWHQDIVKRGRMYHGVFMLVTGANGPPCPLYFGYSTDGLAWTWGASALLNAGVSGHWDDTQLARACIVPTAGGYDMWYSGFTGSSVIYIGRTPVTLS